MLEYVCNLLWNGSKNKIDWWIDRGMDRCVIMQIKHEWKKKAWMVESQWWGYMGVQLSLCLKIVILKCWGWKLVWSYLTYILQRFFWGLNREWAVEGFCGSSETNYKAMAMIWPRIAPLYSLEWIPNMLMKFCSQKTWRNTSWAYLTWSTTWLKILFFWTE